MRWAAAGLLGLVAGASAFDGSCPSDGKCPSSAGGQAGEPCCQITTGVNSSFECCYNAESCIPKVGCRCAGMLQGAGLGLKYNESIAHAIHSITVDGLRLFNPAAGEKNGVPTVNRNMRSSTHVVENAPLVVLESGGFATEPMKVINSIFTHLGEMDDGLGETWSPVERIVHEFHMRDLWVAIQRVHDAKVAPKPPSAQVCACLLDTKANGVHAGVEWVAEQYKNWTPITLLNRPIPSLTDKASWKVWQGRITHYYDDQSLFDAATYLNCAVGPTK